MIIIKKNRKKDKRSRKIKKAHVVLAKDRASVPEHCNLMWAYGSNLSHRQMRNRCPDARPLARLNVADGVLTFRGVADVESRKDGVIAGGLWRVTQRCIRALDHYEGVHLEKPAYEKRFMLLEVNGRPERCLYYKMLPQDDEELGVMPPWDSYLKTIEEGYRDFGLDRRLLDEALARAWGEKDKTEDLLRRWRNKGKPRLVRPAPRMVLQ